MYAYILYINNKDIQEITKLIILSLSIQKTNTKYEIACMIPYNISHIINTYKLSNYFKNIHIIPDKYDNLDLYLLNLLNLPYDKILYLNNSQLVLHNIDNLFDLQAPCGVFNNVNSNYYVKDGYYDYYRSKYDKEYKLYLEHIPHNHKIKEQDIINSLKNSFVFLNGTLLLEPFSDASNKFDKLYNKSLSKLDKYKNKYKYCKSNIGSCIIAKYYAKSWSNIERQYCFYAFYDSNSTILLDTRKSIKVYNYMDIHPIQDTRYILIPEYKLWWDIYNSSNLKLLSKPYTNQNINILTKPKNKNPKYAITTLLMLGDAYLGGCITFATSYRLSHTNIDISDIDLICMITKDVSEYARFVLSLFFDRIIEVDYIDHKVKPMKTRKQEIMYSKWSDKSFTKWQCLKFTEYEKIYFLDADTLVLENITDVFNIPTPAGNFDMPWSDKYIKGFKIVDPYKDLYNIDGEAIKSSIIQEALDKSFVVAGTSVLLKPSQESYDDYMKLLKDNPVYGHPSYSMFDEQSITELYLKKKIKWHYISRSYNFVPWKTSMSTNFSMKIIHYFNIKPWHMSIEELYKWPDNSVYIYFAQKVFKKYIFLLNLFKDFRRFNINKNILFNGLIVLSQKTE